MSRDRAVHIRTVGHRRPGLLFPRRCGFSTAPVGPASRCGYPHPPPRFAEREKLRAGYAVLFTCHLAKPRLHLAAKRTFPPGRIRFAARGLPGTAALSGFPRGGRGLPGGAALPVSARALPGVAGFGGSRRRLPGPGALSGVAGLPGAAAFPASARFPGSAAVPINLSHEVSLA